jgi:hypothetical protein
VYGSTVSLTSVLDGGWVDNTTPWLLYPWERDPVPLCRRLGGPQGQSGPVWKISPPLEFDSQTVHLVASPCINYTTPAHVCFPAGQIICYLQTVEPCEQSGC